MTTEIKYDFQPRVRLTREKDAIAQKEQIRRTIKDFAAYLRAHHHTLALAKFLKASDEILATEDYDERRDKIQYLINLWIETETEKLARALR